MREAALLPKPSPVLPPPAAAPAVSAGARLVQAKSGLGGGGTMMAPPITDAGRPLDSTTRQTMESGFGQDFGHVRVHDDARAHDHARELNARAYAAGDHIVFGEGHYRPETAMGRALIAHELAHTVQQGGVQMKADGPLPAAADAELEGQADRAAAAVTAGRSAPALSRIGAPAVFRAPGDEPAPSGTPDPAPAPAPTAPQGQTTQSAKNVPAWVTGFENDSNPADLAPAYLGVRHGPVFKMPLEKGANDAVQEAYKRGGAVSTVYTTGNQSSYKEGLSSEGYQSQWLGKYGYTSFAALSKTVLGSTDPDVVAVLDKPAGANSKNFDTNRKFVTALAGGIRAAGCAVDHIVEKHMGGASVPSNLQLFDDKRNSASGSQSWNKVKDLVSELRAPGMRGAKAAQIQIFYTAVEVDKGPPDPSYEIEKLVSTKLKGSDKVIKAAEGVPVNLVSGPNHAVTNIKDKGTSIIDTAAERVVQGLKLTTYTRSPAGPAGKFDEAVGEFDHKAMQKLKPADSIVKIKAEKIAAPAAPNPPAGGGDAVAADAARETRKFEIAPGPRKIPFEYPNLSPGFVTSLAITDKGELTGSGVIYPRIKFLGEIHFNFTRDTMTLSRDIDPKSLKSPIPGFRFTGGKFDMQLAPKLVPSGTVNFELGPQKKPIVTGDVTAKYEGGAFIAEGNIKPGPGIPGAEGASGQIRYASDKGWSGRLDITSSAIKNTVINASVVMQQKGEELDIQAEGGAKITIKDKVFDLRAKWVDGSITYSFKGKWEKPFKIVDEIEATVLYRNDYLKITGGGGFHFRTWSGHIDMVYERFSGGGVKVSGTGNVDVETKDKKGKGSLEAHIDETGAIWGKGKIAYQITPTIRPELEVDLDRQNHLHITGSLTLGPYTLFDRYPKDGRDNHEIFKIKSPKFTVPTPILGVTVYAQLTASVGYGFYIGPAIVESIKITGSFDPLEENPNVVAKLVGKFDCPVGAKIYGTLGAHIGADAAMGLAELDGGITVTPSLDATAHAKAEATGEYAQGNFKVGVKPSVDLSLDAMLKIGGEVTASAAWGLFSHTWDFEIASYTQNLGKKTLDFGELSASFGSGQAMPGAQDKAALPQMDPIDLIKDIVNRRKDKEKPNPNYDPNARPPGGHDYVGGKI